MNAVATNAIARRDANDRKPAVRSGDIYCSPQCGFGCTWAAYTRAVTEADEPAKRLGPGWSAHVRENLGWHYAARRGVCRINVSLKRGGAVAGAWEVDGYMAWINTSPQYISKTRGAPPRKRCARR